MGITRERLGLVSLALEFFDGRFFVIVVTMKVVSTIVILWREIVCWGEKMMCSFRA